MHVSEKQPNSDLSYRRCLWVPYVRICTIKSHTDDSGVMIVKAYFLHVSDMTYSSRRATPWR